MPQTTRRKKAIAGAAAAEPVAAATTKAIETEQSYWNNFYAKFDIDIPSQFGVMVATEGDRDMPLVEFGCGNGRDAIYLASHGFRVHASDLSPEAVDRNTTKAGKAAVADRASFALCDVSVPSQVQGLITRARTESVNPATKTTDNVVFYNRFFLHTLDDAQEKIFLTAVAEAAVPGDKLYMEFRSLEDANVSHVYGEGHYRRYVDTDKLVQFLTGKDLRFHITYQITGQGMAKYKTEDPFVSRIIAVKL